MEAEPGRLTAASSPARDPAHESGGRGREVRSRHRKQGVIKRRKQQPPPPSCAYGRPPPSALLRPDGSWPGPDSPNPPPLRPPGVLTGPCAPRVPPQWPHSSLCYGVDGTWTRIGAGDGCVADQSAALTSHRAPHAAQRAEREPSRTQLWGPTLLAPSPSPCSDGGCEHWELPGPRGGSQVTSPQRSCHDPISTAGVPIVEQGWLLETPQQSHRGGYPCMPAPRWSQEPTRSPAGHRDAWEPAAPGACQAPGRAAGAGTPLPWGKLSWFSSSRGSRQSVQGWDGAAATAETPLRVGVERGDPRLRRTAGTPERRGWAAMG